MGWGEWMAGACQRSLESQAQIEIHRRSVKAMPESELRALADSLVVQAHDQAAILRAAMRRIAELEVRHALINSQMAAQSMQPQRQRHLLTVLKRFWLRWRRDRPA